MSHFSADEITDMLDGLGRDVELDGNTVRAIVETRQLVADGVGGLICTEPKATIATALVELLGLTAGPTGSELSDGDMTYLVLAMLDDGDGFTSLRLELVS